MILIKRVCICLIIYSFPILGTAQYISIYSNQVTAQALVDKLAYNTTCFAPFKESIKGNLRSKSYAIFEKNGSNFPFDSGILLSTWSSRNSEGPYNKYEDNNPQWNGDTDIENIIPGLNSINATALEFDFIAHTSFLSFDYIFASNEYMLYFPCEYSDGLAFLIKDVTLGSDYTNIAVLPNGTPVSSKNIHLAIDSYDNNGFYKVPKKCDAKNEAYFGQLNSVNPNASAINYVGQTVPLTAKTTLIVGHQYHIKLVIANDADTKKNSAVFIEAKNFMSKLDLGPDYIVATKNALHIGERLNLKTNLPSNIYVHKWYKDDFLIPTATYSSFEVSEAGTYIVEATDKNNCTFTGEIKVEYIR